jgi:hypothetical protein
VSHVVTFQPKLKYVEKVPVTSINIRVHPTVNRHIYSKAIAYVFYAGNTKRNLAYFRRKFPYVNLRRCNQTNFYSKLKNYGDIDAKKI